MYRLIASAVLPCAALLFSPAAVAQTAARSDPAAADVIVPVPPLTYASPFARYRAYVDAEVAPWRETNDTVGRIGGWREYAREAAQSAAAPAVTGQSVPAGPAPVPAPAASGHDHMHKH